MTPYGIIASRFLMETIRYTVRCGKFTPGWLIRVGPGDQIELRTTRGGQTLSQMIVWGDFWPMTERVRDLARHRASQVFPSPGAARALAEIGRVGQ